MSQIRPVRAAAAALVLACLLPGAARGGRLTLSLDGTWTLAESVAGDEPPGAAFDHRGPVPGLADLAVPSFVDVDRYESKEFLNHPSHRPLAPAGVEGIARQRRGYFWYERSFTAPARREVARLRINKAQFGTAVWLNGKKIGEHLGCFTAGVFDLTGAIRWDGTNRLVVRIGAHPGVLPPTHPAGTDFEKIRWTPGIYDSVSLLLSDGPIIEGVQVAPRIATGEAVVQTRVRNPGGARTFTLVHVVRPGWDQTGAPAAELRTGPIRLGAGEERVLTHTLRLAGARLWAPESPSLYLLESSTGGDSLKTRFGMREFRFDTATRRAYLNGSPYFLRGSNITLHRFFEDPRRGALPWDEGWVRRLLVDIPRRLHWNSFRFCIGPVPDRWLDIADEAGLLIENEFFIWSMDGGIKGWDPGVLTEQLKEWMRDNWNHPSVVIWDAMNETTAEQIGGRIIPAIRGLDLSGRPWETGWDPPSGPDDPMEDHPYLFAPFRKPRFRMVDLETMSGAESAEDTVATGHARILNEYGWLWLHRDGTPTRLTKEVYDGLLGPRATPAERRSLYAYLLGGLTEYWRAHRSFAGVLHFVYLTADYPESYTADPFRDIARLELDPDFADYAGQAFKPLGVYINFWHDRLQAGSAPRFVIMMLNDGAREQAGELSLSLLGRDGGQRVRVQVPFRIPPLGQHTYRLVLPIPQVTGPHTLQAAAQVEGGPASDATLSRRRVLVVAR